MSRDVRSRVVLGIGIPVAALAFLAALIFAFSRILLAVPESLAPWVALLFAATILAGCTVAATVEGTRGFGFLVGVLILTILGGGIVGAALGERPVHSLVEEEQPGPPEGGPAPPPPGESPPAQEPPPPPGGAVTVVAQSLAFNPTAISLPAGAEAAILLDNRDAGIPHNVSIYTQPGGDALFEGEIITGPAQTTYRLPAPEPGQYHFQCDVHPQMSGTVAVG